MQFAAGVPERSVHHSGLAKIFNKIGRSSQISLVSIRRGVTTADQGIVRFQELRYGLTGAEETMNLSGIAQPDRLLVWDSKVQQSPIVFQTADRKWGRIPRLAVLTDYFIRY
jgi:hypothetical protein